MDRYIYIIWHLTPLRLKAGQGVRHCRGGVRRDLHCRRGPRHLRSRRGLLLLAQPGASRSPFRCRSNAAHVSKTRPGSGLDFQIIIRKTLFPLNTLLSQMPRPRVGAIPSYGAPMGTMPLLAGLSLSFFLFLPPPAPPPPPLCLSLSSSLPPLPSSSLLSLTTPTSPLRDAPPRRRASLFHPLSLFRHFALSHSLPRSLSITPSLTRHLSLALYPSLSL